MASYPDAAGEAFLFGSFELIPAQRMLFNGGCAVRVGNRALEILVALVERCGELVTKQELIARAWPNTVVEESNLKVQIAALRKALGEGPHDQHYLATVVGRGYRFVAPVKRVLPARDETHGGEWPRSSNNIPLALVRPLGRAADIQSLLKPLLNSRLVTVAGPGGIGKTTVALAVARQMFEAGEHEVWFVDLSTIADAHLVPNVVAAALGLAVHSNDVASALASYFALRERPQLVVFDSCEHVIEAACAIVERIVCASPRVLVLATSREPLAAAGEHVYRLEPLASPLATEGLTADVALRYPAVQLFMERASARRGDFELNDDDAPVVAEICRRLDGIALAIELAATRLDAFGLRELLGLLSDRFFALGQGRRTAPERHRTLAAMLDWSHQLLPEVERVVLRRVGMFAGSFVLRSAEAVATGGGISSRNAIDAMASLVAKSMVAADVRGETVHYRLLDSTRDYARRKLADAGELDTVARRHAGHFLDMYARAEDQWSTPPERRWAQEHLRAIDDVRAALDWAFAARAEAELGVALTVAAIPAWLRLSSLEECRNRVQQALSSIDGGSPAFDRYRMKLHAALAAAAMYTCGMIPEVDVAWRMALAIAKALDDKEYQLRALFAGCCALVYEGKNRAADELLENFHSVAEASGNAVALSDGDRLTAFTWHHMGKQAETREHLERVLSRHLAPLQRPQLSPIHVDWRNGSRTILSNVLWLQGLADQALRTEHEARSDALASGHSLTLGYVLALASVPIALQVGDLVAAQAHLKLLQDHLAKHGLVIFEAMACCLHGAVLIECGEPSGLPILRAGLEQFKREHIGLRYAMYAGIYARGLRAFGRNEEAHTAVDEALSWANAHDELWCMPELLRIKGEILEETDALDMLGMSESLYQQAIELSCQQGAPSWALRAATSLARLSHRLGKTNHAQTVLVSVYEQFTEGFETADLKAAKAKLDGLRRTRV
ncbi:helix-turn-helix transcriptional regulator [Paraburkholderia sp. CNPSo 3274]|uniref:ATP-binding protein n=1 Tax=Paraburkholderia sp. CNPSo 3274 TaxID=2940932 RepID=UPI0020B7CC48|nr:winged helix-turn-helix domain-containing protein [Paraburkholderia sp. CNPSo 3274]MCP3709280.1 helix-turn-helix transcriptional regulator [Paraburkholderia sp. CNPSo 3274]